MDELETTTAQTEVKAEVTEVKEAPATLNLTQAELDRMIQQAVKSNAENVKKKAEKDLAEKSMTETQKLNALAEELRAERESIKRERAEVAARAVLSQKGLSEAEYSELLGSIVTTDVDETKAKAEKLGDHIMSIAQNLATKKIQEQMENAPIMSATAKNTNVSLTAEQAYKQLMAEVAKNPGNRELTEKVFMAKEAMIKEKNK